MNNIRKCVIIDIKYLLKYKEFLLNKKYQLAKYCTICCDNCNGSCMNNNFTHISNINNNIKLRMMTCSNNCNENIYNDCICL